jgi:predicted DsbA family dithiol-disulfide isomerase
MIEVEIWSDIACPFCYIGKRNFERALEIAGKKDEVKIVYRSFELDPTAEKGRRVAIDEVLAKKYGRSVEWARKMNENVTQTAASCGLKFEMSKIVPTNTFDAHRLSHLAAKHGKQALAQEHLFAAYFTEGRDIADPETLKGIATSLDLPANEVEEMLRSESFAADVREEESMAQELGIQGVPFFLFEGKLAVSGAQPPEVFTRALSEI